LVSRRGLLAFEVSTRFHDAGLPESPKEFRGSIGAAKVID
jgi:hypothetical protein